MPIYNLVADEDNSIAGGSVAALGHLEEAAGVDQQRHRDRGEFAEFRPAQGLGAHQSRTPTSCDRTCWIPGRDRVRVHRLAGPDRSMAQGWHADHRGENEIFVISLVVFNTFHVVAKL